MLTGVRNFPVLLCCLIVRINFSYKPFAPVTNIFMYEISKILTNQSIMMNHTSRSSPYASGKGTSEKVLDNRIIIFFALRQLAYPAGDTDQFTIFISKIDYSRNQRRRGESQSSILLVPMSILPLMQIKPFPLMFMGVPSTNHGFIWVMNDISAFDIFKFKVI